jgi:hypothetical protein
VYAQDIMRKGVVNGDTNVPPRKYEVPSHLYYTKYGVSNGEFGEINYGIKSVQNFINFRPVIMKLQKSNCRASTL